MTLRSLIIGLSLAIFVSMFDWGNDLFRIFPYTASEFMPVTVLGLLMLGLLLLNLLLKTLRKRKLRGTEMAVVFGLVLTASALPGPGFFWQCNAAPRSGLGWQVFDGAMFGEVAKATPETEQQKTWVVPAAEAPFPSPVPDGKSGDGSALLAGKASETGWLRHPYAFWVPLLFFAFVASICLLLILHTQWSKHESLPYPLVRLASNLIGENPQNPFSQLLRSRLFWGGFVLAFLVLLLDGLYAWSLSSATHGFTIVMYSIPISSLSAKMVGWYTWLPYVSCVGIGLAFLIKTDVSFSIGISMIAYSLLVALLAACGVAVNREGPTAGVNVPLIFGSYLGVFAFIVYIGRQFYWKILKSAFGRNEVPASCSNGHWFFRIFLVAVLTMIFLLRFVGGIDWLFAIFLVFLFGMLFVVLTRINAEAGIFILQPVWQPIVVLAAVFGTCPVEPGTLVIGILLCAVLSVGSRSWCCLFPALANALKFGEELTLRPMRLGKVLLVGFALCLLVASVASVSLQHSSGRAGFGQGGGTGLSSILFGPERNQLLHGIMQQAPVAEASPDPTFLWIAALGFVLVIVCYVARRCWPWCPIHPLMFLIWGTFISRWFAPSFLLGAIIKWAVNRFGSEETYKIASRFFLGLIAGEMIARILWIFVGEAYYRFNGIPSPRFFL